MIKFPSCMLALTLGASLSAYEYVGTYLPNGSYGNFGGSYDFSYIQEGAREFGYYGSSVVAPSGNLNVSATHLVTLGHKTLGGFTVQRGATLRVRISASRTCTWIADTPKSFTDPSAWSLNIVPGPLDLAVFNANHSGDMNFPFEATSIGCLRFDGYAGGVTFGGELRVNGNGPFISPHMYFSNLSGYSYYPSLSKVVLSGQTGKLLRTSAVGVPNPEISGFVTFDNVRSITYLRPFVAWGGTMKVSPGAIIDFNGSDLRGQDLQILGGEIRNLSGNLIQCSNFSCSGVDLNPTGYWSLSADGPIRTCSSGSIAHCDASFSIGPIDARGGTAIDQGGNINWLFNSEPAMPRSVQ